MMGIFFREGRVCKRNREEDGHDIKGGQRG
jgi:hypothetical protein